MSSVSSAPRWNKLKEFTVTVTSGSNLLYANGRQQLKLTVKMEGEDEFLRPVRLSQSELSSLRLIEYHGGREVAFDNANYPSVGAVTSRLLWDYSQHQSPIYRFYPSHSRTGVFGATASSTSPVNANEASLYKDFYVRTVADTTLRIAAKITRDDGQVFISSGEPDGSVTLVPLEVPRYGPEDYSFNPITIGYDAGVTYDYIPFGLNSSHAAVEFRSVLLSDSSAVKHIVTRNGAGTLVFTGFTFPGGSQVHYSHLHVLVPRHIQEGYVLPGRPVIVVARALNTPPTGLPSLRRSIVLRAIDMYGNPHRVTILFKETDGDTRELVLY
mgnify:CR=1 FL=1